MQTKQERKTGGITESEEEEGAGSGAVGQAGSDEEVVGSGRGGFRVTARDVELVRWIGRVRFATAVQVQTRFGLHRAKAYSRLRGLAAAGLIRYEQPFRSAGVYLATRAGLGMVGLDDLRVATVAPGSYAHELAIVDVQIGLELAEGAARVLTEREMRRLGEAYMVRITDTHRSDSRHWPDLALELDAGHRLAVEVELTQKSAKRIDRKLRAYRHSSYDSNGYQGVVYYVPDERFAQRLESQRERAAVAESFVQVRVLRAAEPTEQARQHAAQVFTAEAARVRELEDAARNAAYLQNQLTQHHTKLANAEQKIEQLQSTINELRTEREIFARGGMTQRRRLTKQWEAELRDAGHVR